MAENELLLAEIWREASRHMKIQEFTASIARQLAPLVRFERVLVRRLDTEQFGLVTVANANCSGPTQAGVARTDWSERDYEEFNRWCRSGQILLGEPDKWLSSPIAPRDDSTRLAAAPLVLDDNPEGVLVFDGIDDGAANDWTGLMEMLREPFAVALENDRRIHEIASLREAAKAEHGALLRRLGRSRTFDDTIIGSQTGLRGVMERVALVASSDVPVLVLGETGSGKEVVARALHHQGRHPEGPFIRVNCGAIPRELIDSQLFGHEKGSFTGADRMHHGWFERADGGTLFLDEVGELSLAAQVRLLRVLQDGFVERVGGTASIHVEVRVVAATHRDLAAMVSTGEFREDLWYRLAVFPILIPPLRERRGDIPALVRHFAARAATRFGLPVAAAATEDLWLLQDYDWPGNIRELTAVIDRAAILGAGKILDIETALGWPGHANAFDSRREAAESANKSQRFSTTIPLDKAIQRHIEAALEFTRGRVEGPEGAASILKVNPHTLRSRMRKLGIDWAAFRR